MPKRKPRRAQLGLSLEQYDALLADQAGGCAICGNPPKTRRLDVDHDHKTGRIRGLLCHRCNRVMWPGVTVEWLLLAIAYLRRYGDAVNAGSVAAAHRNATRGGARRDSERDGPALMAVGAHRQGLEETGDTSPRRPQPAARGDTSGGEDSAA